MQIDIKCYECQQCNHIGKPSVMKGSAYCDSHRVKESQVQVVTRIGLFQRFKDFMFDKRYKDADDEKKRRLESKGFRPSWFWR